MVEPIDLTGSAVVFDMDGVLIDTDEPIAALWTGVIGRRLERAELDRYVFGRSPVHTVTGLLPDLPVERQAAVLAEIDAAEPDLDFRPVPGARELVAALRAGGIALALVTSGSAVRVERVLHGLDIAEAFAVRVTAGDAPSKPAPDCYLLAAERLGVPPGRCVVFEDSVSGVRSALAAGARCVGVAGRGGAAELIGLGAEHVIPDLAAVRIHGTTLELG